MAQKWITVPRSRPKNEIKTKIEKLKIPHAHDHLPRTKHRSYIIKDFKQVAVLLPYTKVRFCHIHFSSFFHISSSFLRPAQECPQQLHHHMSCVPWIIRTPEFPIRLWRHCFLHLPRRPAWSLFPEGTRRSEKVIPGGRFLTCRIGITELPIYKISQR